MNSKSSNNLLNNKENPYSSYKLFPNIVYKLENQGKYNFQYFPIVTKNSLEGNRIIYLATQNNGNSNNFIMNENGNNYEYKTYKNNKKLTNQNIILIIQKSIQLQIIKKKFEYLLKTPTKNIEINNDNNNNLFNNENKVLRNSNNEQIKKKINYENIKNDFISTTINLFDKPPKKENKKLFHSYSVGNYGRVQSGSLPNFNMNLISIEDSKIMEKNFINKIRNTNRKDNLIKLLEQYKRFKTYNKINNNNISNNSFIIGLNQNIKRKKIIERLYTLNNNVKMIEEVENENSENDTLREKQNLKDKEKDKIEDNWNNVKNINNKQKKFISENEEKKEIIKSCKNELINLGNFKKIQNVNRIKNLNIKNMIKNDNLLKDNILRENRKNIKDKNKDIYKEYFNNNNSNKQLYKNLNIKINNNNSSNLDNIGIINSKNNINKIMINNNKNMHKKINNYIDKNKTQVVLVRKILREERYIIDENGREKLLGISQSLLNENKNRINIIKKPEIDDKNKTNHLGNNTYINFDNKMLKKERYHRINKKFPEKRKIMINDIEDNNLNNKIKKINIIKSTSNINQNSQNQGKERFHFDKINRPFIIKRNNKVLQNNSTYNNIYRNQYKNININNNLNHVIYIQNKISTNKSSQNSNSNIIQETEKGNLDKKYINRNHSYREINSMRSSKDNISRTIYHDYSNLDRRMIYNNSTVQINKQNSYNESKCGLNRNYSLNISHKTQDKTNKGLIMGKKNNSSYVYKQDYSNGKIYNNNYKIIDDVNKNNYKYSRNVIKIRNKIKYHEEKSPDSIKSCTNELTNKVINGKKIYEQNLINIYPHNNSLNSNHRKNPIKIEYVSNEYIFQTEDREYNKN